MYPTYEYDDAIVVDGVRRSRPRYCILKWNGYGFRDIAYRRDPQEAAVRADLESVPCVVRESWDEGARCCFGDTVHRNFSPDMLGL